MATFTVTNTHDSGEGSLRWAIEQANRTPGLDQISFNLSIRDLNYDRTTKTFQISIATHLPAITDAVLLDGTTQVGYAQRPLIQIKDAAWLKSGLVVAVEGAGSTIRGFIINGFNNGIVLEGGK